jgi:hypothetical protein
MGVLRRRNDKKASWFEGLPFKKVLHLRLAQEEEANLSTS